MISDITSEKLKPAGTDSTDSKVGASRLHLTGSTWESPVLQAAAKKGRTAMALLKMPNMPLESQVQYEQSRRQSLKQATESLLSATKATALLAGNIAEIRKRQLCSTRREKTNGPDGVCLLELHKTFLKLAQDLLNSVDPYLPTSSMAPSSRSPVVISYPKVPPDDQLVDLLLKLSYRAHQLSLSFTWPLYQRLVITVAKQPQLSTLRSRAKWILCVYQWCQSSWGTKANIDQSGIAGVADIDLGTKANIRQSVTAAAVDVDWFRPSLLELAKHQHWSDLGYLLRNILHPPMSGTLNDRPSSRRRYSSKNSTNTAIKRLQEVHESANDQPSLDEALVRELLLALEHHKVLPSLWKNLKNPSVVEEDVLEILILLERSIWNVFDYETGPASDSSFRQKGFGKPGENPKASLRDAIDVLLQSSRRYELDTGSAMQVSKHDDQEFESHDDAEHDEAVQLVLDFKDILEETKNPEDDSYDQESVDALTIAAMLLDQKTSRVTNSVQSRAMRSGDHHLLEARGVGKEAKLKSSNVPHWIDVIDEIDATDVIYSRDAGYHDDIPDVASQIYQHNGNRVLRYQSDFEYEICEELRQTSQEDEWNETEFADDSLL
jgi:hypothetical protein